MPVRKYRSVTDMPGVRPLRPLDPDNLRIACELTELSFALHPWRFEPGVRKFRSLAEANQHRQEWDENESESTRGSHAASFVAARRAFPLSLPANRSALRLVA